MITLKTRDGNGIKFTGQCTDVVDIDALTPHPANAAWRADSEISVDEEKEILKESILANGLREPITAYQGSKIIISGHTRIEALRVLGAVEIPVHRLPRTSNMPQKGEIDPMHPDVLNEHAISNTRVSTTTFGRYQYARSIMESKFPAISVNDPVKGNIPTQDKLNICKTAGIGVNTFDYVEKIRFGYHKIVKDVDHFVGPRSDLYRDLGDKHKDYSVRQLEKIQWQDYRSQHINTSHPAQKFMDDALDQINFKRIAEAVDRGLAQVAGSAKLHGYDGNWFDQVDDNYVSATAHHIICPCVCAELNAMFKKMKVSAVAQTDTKQAHYDVHIMDNAGNEISSVEIKTTFGKSNWASGTSKVGYALLFAYNKERDRYFGASVYLDEQDWDGGVKGKYTLSAETLYNKPNRKTYLGDIEVDNGVYRIQKQRL